MESLDFVKTELQKFNLTDAVLFEMRGRAMSILVKDEKDTENYQKAREMRLVVKGKRIEVEKKRKELKEDALAYGRAVDGEAKRIAVQLEEFENHLQTQEDVVGKYQERLQREAAVKAEADRIAKEQAVEAERIALAEERAKLEAEKQKIEAEKLQAERERLERAEAERRAIEAEKNRAENEKRRIAEMEAAKVEAAKKAVRETEERLRRESEEKVRKEREALAKKQAEEEKAKRKAANAPDKEKLLGFAKVISSLTAPDMKTIEARDILAKGCVFLDKAARFIEDKCKELD